MTEIRGASSGRRDHDLVVRGRLTGDAGGPDETAVLALLVPASTLVAGRGPAELHVDMPTLHLRGATIEWIVRTNAGWTHVRGAGTSGEDETPVTFRLDLLFLGDVLRVARVAIRVYLAESVAGAHAAPPVLRIAGDFVPAEAFVGRRPAIE